MSSHFVVWSDASFSIKRNECNISYIVKDGHNKSIAKFYGRLNVQEVIDINIAEYMAINKALEFLISNNIYNFTLFTDSETVHSSLHREGKHKLMYLREHLMEMLSKHNKTDFLNHIKWGSRLYNKADFLCREQNVKRELVSLPIFPLQRDKSYRLYTKMSQRALKKQLIKFEDISGKRLSTKTIKLGYQDIEMGEEALTDLIGYKKHLNYSITELQKILIRNLVLAETYIFDANTKLYVYEDMHVFVKNNIIKVIALKETKLSQSFDRNPILEWLQPLSYKLGIA